MIQHLSPLTAFLGFIFLLSKLCSVTKRNSKPKPEFNELIKGSKCL